MSDDRVVSLDGGESWAPNQIALDLLHAAEQGEVEAVAVVLRGPDGQLQVDWSRPMGVAVLCEMARYFQLAADEELLESNDAERDEEDSCPS